MEIYSFNKTKYLLGEAVGKSPQEMKMLLGGKGYGLHEMCAAGMPVPPGFTMTTEWSVAYNAMPHDDRLELLDKAMNDMVEHLKEIENQLGYMPLLSVRSGAPVSMPGMMDTILNVGLTDENFSFYADRYGTRTALDSYRRLIQMMGCTAFELDHKEFEAILTHFREASGAETDAHLDEVALEKIVAKFKTYFKSQTGMEFPQAPHDQIRYATRAVFDSWSSDRAVHYRKMENIDSKMGTAVNIQAMVFGNMNERSGTGVFFTRNPTTGDRVLYGEYLTNAQGEDVVAGIRTPVPISEMAADQDWLSVFTELEDYAGALEQFYGDMVDGEFTVEDGKFYLLQSRTGKRTPIAALQIAMDLIEEGLRSVEDLPKLVKPRQYLDAQISVVDPSCNILHDLDGIPACPGVVTGKAMFSAEAAVACKEPCILVTNETTPDDIAGMDAALGILTAMGGATSHAAVVARAMNRPCVVGATKMTFPHEGTAVIQSEHGSGMAVAEGDMVTICGQTGRVWFHKEIPVVDVSSSDLMEKFNALAVQGSNDFVYGHNGQVVSSTDFMTKKEMLDAIIASGKDLKVLDIRSTVSRVADIDGSQDWFAAMGYLVEEPILNLSDLNLDGVIVLSARQENIDAANKAGAKLVKEAGTVDDLVTGKGTFMKEATIKKVFGTKKTMDKVKKALGFQIIEQVEPVPVKVAVMNLLGEN